VLSRFVIPILWRFLEIILRILTTNLNSIISDLGKLSNGDTNLGWLIGRPIVASVAMTILTPLLTKFFFAPVFRKYIELHFALYDHISNIILMVLVLCAFISIAAYTGTSILYGAFLAGTFLSYLPSKRPDSPFVVESREEGEKDIAKSPTFVHTFEAYLLGVQTYLMEPLFFASIGFAIPFVQLWTGKRIWRGILFTLLMVVAKVSLPYLLGSKKYHSSFYSSSSDYGSHYGNYRQEGRRRPLKRQVILAQTRSYQQRHPKKARLCCPDYYLAQQWSHVARSVS
jgi:Kef-type K+ transport system membrane component KefB